MTRSHRSAHLKIYPSRKNLLITLLFIAVPFLFLIIFSRAANITTSNLFKDFFVSFYRLLVAYIIGAILAWILAISFYRGARAKIALPIFDVLQSFPTFAALPLVVFLLGNSNITIIFFLILTVIWPIFFSIIGALRLSRKDWGEAAEIYNLKGIDYIKKFILPLSAPGIITGSIIGLGDGWGALVATELIVNVRVGLGSFFSSYSRDAIITAFGILGVLLFVFVINYFVWSPLLEWSHQVVED